MAREVIAALLNPEPHPLQEEWSDAHSMTTEQLVNKLAEALSTAHREGLVEASRIVGGYRVIHTAEHVWGVGESERNRVCSHLEEAIRLLSKGGGE